MSIASRLKSLLGIETKAGISSPEPWLIELFGAAPTLAGVNVTPYTAMTCAPVACAVRAISEAVGQLPLHVYKRLPDGGKERAVDHPLYKILHDAPNGWTPSALFRGQVTADSLLQPYGGFAQIVRVDSKPYELIRLDPQLSSIVVDFNNFEPAYAIKTDDKNPARISRASDILHIHTPAYNPSRGLVGEGREAIALALVLERHASRLFGNAARPSGVLSLKSATTPDAIAKIKTAWTAAHGGDNSGGTAILPSDASWQALTLTSTDAQFLEMRKFAIAEIARLYRVPLHLLYELETATPRSIESLGQEFLSQTLLPHLTRWEQELELKLLTPGERDQYCIEFNVDGFARADLLARSQALSAAVAARILNPNEARQIGFGYPAYEGGDVFENHNTSSAYVRGALNRTDNSEPADA
ncbi:phage portal protein [Bradyrhizobium sp. Leo170]|uniref:phage portal protein n=1 Tax=Bradyrhizobium sp. Leo170 TaxID=1571199 RepID=UPI00102E3E1B|nr:phage portal protein [Bradyrhizobium sp. Leo170]TAI61924.1 phage portal protein [Bradyrhizobium sp. Leo170]